MAIKCKHFQFIHNNTNYFGDIIFDDSPFGYGEKSFFKALLLKINGKILTEPLTYEYTQHRGWIQQSRKFREHSYYCSPINLIFENKTNIYFLLKEQFIYQYENYNQIKKYENQVNDFNRKIDLKYDLLLSQYLEMRKSLKKQLKSGEINNIVYQKLYTPIRKEKEKLQFFLFDIKQKYRARYFQDGKLKKNLYL